jgi:hypothetical protein
MNLPELDAMVRDIITHFGLPFTVLSISESPVGWNILLRGGVAGLMRFSVANGRPSAMRVDIQNQLEAQP